MSGRPIRAVVFDLFDTLVDLDMAGLPVVEVHGRRFPSTAEALYAELSKHVEVPWEAFTEALISVERELRAPRAEAGRELPTLERFQVLLGYLGVAAPDLPGSLTRTHMDLVRGQVGVLEHHAALLASLHERVRLAVCSNFSHSQTALAILEDAGLRWHLDAVLVSDAIGWRKPRREVFEATLASLGVEACETLHVGDSLPSDVAGAAATGIRSAWITRRVPEPQELLHKYRGPRPDHVLADLAELADLPELCP